MRKNEYTSLDDFRSQYIGVWAPSEGHWLGLDFSYKGNEYRFQTGSNMQKKTRSCQMDRQLFMVYIVRTKTRKTLENTVFCQNLQP